MKKLFSMLAVSALLLGVWSCSDDDDPPQTPTYTVTVRGGTGGGTFAGGDRVTITATVPPGYEFDKWEADSDSVDFANANSATTSFTMPRINVTITAVMDAESTFVDPRGGGTTYRQVLMPDGKIWMAENLNFDVAGAWCNSNATQCARYGRLYSWDAMMNGESESDEDPSGVRGICPAGWHVPSAAEWEALFAAIDNDEKLGTMLKANAHWTDDPDTPVGTDDFGFSALPGGSYRFTDEIHVGNVTEGHWWTATAEPDRDDFAISLFMEYDSETVTWNSAQMSNIGFSVRCVRN